MFRQTVGGGIFFIIGVMGIRKCLIREREFLVEVVPADGIEVHLPEFDLIGEPFLHEGKTLVELMVFLQLWLALAL